MVFKNKLVFVLHLAGCVRGFKSLKAILAFMMAFRSWISTGKLKLLILHLMFLSLFLFGVMNSNVVYAVTLRT